MGSCQNLTKVGEEVLDLVISYIDDTNDRNSVSLVSRKFYEIDGITRKRVTVHTLYYNPSRLSKRFPFIEYLTLKGPPTDYNQTHYHDIRITPWIEQLALEFRCLKELCISGLVVEDEDLKTLATTRGKDLRTLKIKKCEGFQTDGLMHVSKHCNQLRTLCLKYRKYTFLKDGIWFHQLASNSTALERLHVTYTDFIYNAEDITLLAKNCCNSLISLKLIGESYLSKLGDAFKYAVRLEHFGGCNRDAESELVGFQFPPNIRSLSCLEFSGFKYSSVLPFLNQIRKLKFVFADMDEDSQCSLFKRCPNLEVLYTENVCGDRGLQVLGQFCKKLRKLVDFGDVTHVGMVALAKGCTSLECLTVIFREISNEALECVGTHLKNLRKFDMLLGTEEGITDLPLDNGVRAILMGCSKLESLSISLPRGGLTDMGLEYIGKYGTKLRSLSLTLEGNFNEGFMKLLEGCPRLRKLHLFECPFAEQAVTGIVFNIPCLRYIRVTHDYKHFLILTRPEFQL